MVDESHNPWTVLSTREIYTNRWLSLREDQVINPQGGRGIYGVVHLQNLAIGIVPIDAAGMVTLVGQYRYPLNCYSWEIPEGGGPAGEAPLDTAKRELREETGFTAARWDALATLHLSNCVTDEVAYLFLARDLTPGNSEWDETEKLQTKKVPFAEALEMALDGRITDAMSVVGLMKAARVLGV